MPLLPLEAKMPVPENGVTPVDSRVQVASAAADGAAMAVADVVYRTLCSVAE